MSLPMYLYVMLPFLSMMKTAGGCYAVVVEVVDFVAGRDFVVFGGVEDRECGAGVCDHGRGTAEIVHADSEYLGVMLPDAWVVALQLDELPEAYPSEESAIEDEDDVFGRLGSLRA